MLHGNEVYYVYILTTKNHKIFYTGFTDDIYRRTKEHKEKIRWSFTNKYNVTKLVYYEEHQYASDALRREWLIKKYKRKFKINLVNSINPEWNDLYHEFL